MKRDFSLRRPTASQERSGKKKLRPASFEMTGVGGMRNGVGDNNAYLASKAQAAQSDSYWAGLRRRLTARNART
ncbi:MAG: hypothetical protein WA789_02890 [Candidatus Acidiferrum sp.]